MAMTVYSDSDGQGGQP